MEGDVFDGKKRKRDDSDDEGAVDKIVEKPSKKKPKKKLKNDGNSFPGKYVLLKPPENGNEVEIEDSERTAIQTV